MELKMNTMPNQHRLAWIDCTKGIAILLVIVGHTINGFSRSLIFSFHMPLFFILSCRTFQCSTTNLQWIQKTRRAFMHLIIPAIIMYTLIIIIAIWKDHTLLTDFNYWLGRLYTLIYASGVSVKNSEILNNTDIKAIGIPWFFFALFEGRSLYDYLHLKFSEKQLLPICMIVSTIGVIFGKIQWLPLSLDIALSIIPFFLFGDYLKQIKIEEKIFKKIFFSGLIWLLSLMLEYPVPSQWTYMELATRRYPLYPICFVTAIAGTLLLSEIGILLIKLGKSAEILVFIGRNSLYMLCIHIIDFLWYSAYYTENSVLMTSVKRITIDFLIFLIIVFIKELIHKLYYMISRKNL